MSTVIEPSLLHNMNFIFAKLIFDKVLRVDVFSDQIFTIKSREQSFDPFLHSESQKCGKIDPLVHQWDIYTRIFHQGRNMANVVTVAGFDEQQTEAVKLIER